MIHSLKPCPFCGKTTPVRLVPASEDIDFNPDEQDESYTVYCDARSGGCGATCGYLAQVPDDAVDAWNRRRTYIPKADLVHGAYYHGRCRNATVARWDHTLGKFRHWRTKFNNTYLEYIKHPEDDLVYDVFLPTCPLEDDEIALPIPLESEES